MKEPTKRRDRDRPPTLFPTGNDFPAQAEAPPPGISPLKPTPVYDTYWRFAAERQRVFFRRLEGLPPPWTDDPILSAYKFTNAYRASDRVSQYLIRHVIYGEGTCRTIPRRSFSESCCSSSSTGSRRGRSWSKRSARSPMPTSPSSITTKRLTRAMAEGTKIYSAAYIMPHWRIARS